MCDTSVLKNTRGWVGGREEWKLQVSKLDTIIILAINYGKAPELDFFLCHTFVFCVTERPSHLLHRSCAQGDLAVMRSRAGCLFWGICVFCP